MSLSHAFARQLREPAGWAGRLVGVLMRRLNAECNRLAVDALGVGPADRVLELGFGPGHALSLLAARVPQGRVYGIERSGVMLTQARARNRSAVREGRMLLQQGRFESLPFATGSLDAVLAVNVAYFWVREDSTVSEIRRVLRPHGKLALYVTHRNSTQRWRFASHGTHRHWDAETLAEALQFGGFARASTRIEQLKLRGGIEGLLAVARVGASQPCACCAPDSSGESSAVPLSGGRLMR